MRVYLKDAKGMTDSLTIAKEFNKDHKNVLQKIHSCKGDLPAEFGRLNFQPISRTDSMNREQSLYELTRDGFMFLVMGFNGKKASAVKLSFIEDFNRMEATLIDVGLQAAPVTIDDWYRLAKQQEERANRAEAKIVDLHDHAADHAAEHGLRSVTILKQYPEQSNALINEAKPTIKNVTAYGPTGLLTVGLKRRGIKAKVLVENKSGTPVRLFNAKEIHEFMSNYKGDAK